MNLRPLISVIAAAAAIAVAAQVPDGPVTLEQCRELALKNNKSLRMQNEKIKAAHYQNDEAFAAYLPGIDFAGGYMYNQRNISVFDSDQLLPVKSFDMSTQSYQFSVVKNPATGEPMKDASGQYIFDQVALIPKDAMTYDIHNVFFGALTLTQPLYMGGKIVAMNKITKYAEDVARLLRDNQAQDVIYQVDAAYWLVVSLNAKHRLAVSYVNLLDTLRSNVNLMLEQGVATRADLLTVDVKLNSAHVDLTKVENGMVLSRMALAQVCGLPVDADLHLVDENAAAIASGAHPDTNFDIADVYSRRDDLRALETGVKIYGQQEKVARADMLPELALVGTYSFSNPNMFDGFKNRFAGAFSVGAMLKIPLIHWGGNLAKYRLAKTKTAIARLELENARDLINLQVNQAAFKAREAVKTFDMTSTNLAKADENLRQATLGFREGMMSVDNVMEAQTAWLKANSENIDAGIDIYLCDVYLSKVLGRLDTTSAQ